MQERGARRGARLVAVALRQPQVGMQEVMVLEVVTVYAEEAVMMVMKV